MNRRKLLLFSIWIFILGNRFSEGDVDFEFPIFSMRNFTLLGDSYLRNGVVGLTRDLNVPSSSSGSVIYNRPIAFFDPESNKTASFSTRFAFSIENLNPTSFGDGLTFFISPSNQTLGSPGGYLGLMNSTANATVVAVEFDTRLDLHFDDRDDSHVGLDIDSLVSIKAANTMLQDINLKSGNVITAWIEYSSDNKSLAVFLSYTNLKPSDPILIVDIDLSDHLNQGFMYVGFSGSTEGSTEIHYIQNWSFQTRGIRASSKPVYHPHNVSDNSTSVPVEPASIPVADSSNGHHKAIGLGLGIGFPSFFCAALLVFGLFSVKNWRGIQMEKMLKAEVIAGPRQFSYKEIKTATRGFHQSRILGHGAFGTVYKAFFQDTGSVSAVKRSKHTHEGKTEFLSELSIIACLRHKNLVQLQGWCAQKGELLLVYEYMPNGSLDKVLYQDTETDEPLKWTHRYNIAVGLASSLMYLHQECEQQVIHRDIKASNIMLDRNYNARLGDFGLARIMDHDKSPVSTLTAGTMGYLAPEYLQYGKATEKTDVFSYGVVILELACGRRPIEREGESQRMVNLVDWVWSLHTEGRIISAADGRMKGEFDDGGMKRMLLVGLSCANPDGTQRPSMRRVLQILNNEADPVLVPKAKPSLTFSNSLPLSIDEIVSEDSEDDGGGSPDLEMGNRNRNRTQTRNRNWNQSSSKE